MKNYIFKTQIDISKILLFEFLVFMFLIIVYGVLGIKNIERDLWIIIAIILIINYISSIYLFSTHYFFEDKILIKYPTRIKKRSVSIPYNNVIKTKYTKAPKGISKFSINFYHKGQVKTSSFDLFKHKNLEILFPFLHSKNIKIELKIWGERSLYNGKDLQ